VAQMMGGLAYMTGPPGQPLRAGASVIDIAGGMFGVIAILATLERRHRTGRGGEVKCSLFETTAFLVGQHMAQQAVTGEAARPMPVRIPAWAIYDVFETRAAGEQVFVGVVSDAQWRCFCSAFGLASLNANPALATNNQRVLARDKLLPQIRSLFEGFHRAALVEKLEGIGLPFAPIVRPDELFDDAHLTAAGGLIDVTVPAGAATRLPALPIEIDGSRLGLRVDIPRPGRDGADILRGLGLSDSEIAGLEAACG
jgi:crotonobetainyl-CoA:carnitine CoA-transferase CaiB-like acyl-CoA transferase